MDQQYEFDMPYQMACQEFVDIEYNKASDGNAFKFELQVRYQPPLQGGYCTLKLSDYPTVSI